MLKKVPLHIQIVIGLVLGIAWAIMSAEAGMNEFTLDWINPWGTIFIRVLKFIAIPLVLFSIISGISGLSNMSKLGRMGGKTIGIYIVTTMVAITIGLLLVNTISPGKLMDENERIKNRINYELWVEEQKAAGEDIEYKDDRRFLTNPQYAEYVKDIMEEKKEKEKKKEEGELEEEELAKEEKVQELQQTAEQSKEKRPLDMVVEMVPENLFISLSNGKLMLQVIFFAIFFSVVLISLSDERKSPIVKLINGLNDVFIKMVEVVMRAAPFFVFCLMAGQMAKMADSTDEILEIFAGLGWYALAVVAGLIFMAFILYPLVISFFVKDISYSQFLRRISPAQLLAFSSSSSAATLPVTMECVEDGMGVSKNVSSFVLPVGATVNMDGTSLYQAVAVIFLAQMHMIDLGTADQMSIVLTATLASIGAAAVPSAGLVMLMIVLSSVGLNPAWIAIIFPIDRLLDMCRTVVNVTGDATVSTIVAKTENELNFRQDHESELME